MPLSSRTLGQNYLQTQSAANQFTNILRMTEQLSVCCYDILFAPLWLHLHMHTPALFGSWWHFFFALCCARKPIFECIWVTPSLPFIRIQLGAGGFSSPVAAEDALFSWPAVWASGRFWQSSSCSAHRKGAQTCPGQTPEVGRERQGKGYTSPFSVFTVPQPSARPPEKVVSFLSAPFWAINRSDEIFTALHWIAPVSCSSGDFLLMREWPS